MIKSPRLVTLDHSSCVFCTITLWWLAAMTGFLQMACWSNVFNCTCSGTKLFKSYPPFFFRSTQLMMKIFKWQDIIASAWSFPSELLNFWRPWFTWIQRRIMECSEQRLCHRPGSKELALLCSKSTNVLFYGAKHVCTKCWNIMLKPQSIDVMLICRDAHLYTQMQKRSYTAIQNFTTWLYTELRITAGQQTISNQLCCMSNQLILVEYVTICLKFTVSA